MSGLLIRDCSLMGQTGYSVYCEGGKVVTLLHGDLSPPRNDTEVIEANGGALCPGFIDTHCHPFEYGWLRRNVDLRGTSNVTAMRLRVMAGIQRAKPGEWVTGMGWDQEKFPGGTTPTRADIDDISPVNPVALSRVCGHITLLNTRAIEELNFAGRTSPEYERGGSGELTGIVKEKALDEVYRQLPRSQERCAADILSVESEAARMGLTGLHCILSSDAYPEELGAIASLAAAGSLSLRYRLYVPPESMDYIERNAFREKLDGAKVRLNGVKIYADGSLGARTAALREPYSDDPGNTGILRYKDEELTGLVETVDSKGYQAIVHAIGDRAVEQAIEAIATVTGGGNPRRHRIEHASMLPNDLRSKVVRHGIRVSVQPLFVTSDTWAVDRLGEERVRDLYPLRSIVSDGITASGGSDSPVESMNPILGMWAAMTRGGSTPEEALDLEQALSLYTSNARSNGIDPDEPIEVGAQADFTLLDAETVDTHPALFRKIGVLATVVGGAVISSYGAG